MSESEIGKKAEARIKEWLDKPDEIWLPVDLPGYENYYEVSNLGHVRSVGRYVKSTKGSKQFRPGKLLTIHQFIDKHKRPTYSYVVLSKDGRTTNALVHRLVASAFISNPNRKPEVNHIDGDKNHNYVSNLEWVTSKENIQHSYAAELQIPSTLEHMLNMNKKSLVKTKQRVKCNETSQIFDSMKEAAEALGLWKGAVYEYFNKGKPVGGYTFTKEVS